MWHKAPCSSRDYSGVRESGPRKIDEDGDDDGDVDEDDHRGDDSPPDGTPTPPRERRRGSPPCASSSMASPLDGDVGERRNFKKNPTHTQDHGDA